GELLAVEKPYASTLMMNDQSIVENFCCVCTSRCLTPLPCSHCNVVTFCSESCRRDGVWKFHRRECRVLPSLVERGLGLNSILSCRVLAHIPFPQLKSIISKHKEEKHVMTRQLRGFNDQGVYKSSDYGTVFHLEGNFDARELDDLLKKCCLAFILTKLLISSNSYFVDELGNSFE
ncbi:unnamed protein product, partial [Meganyctiphanes norvegica]